MTRGAGRDLAGFEVFRWVEVRQPASLAARGGGSRPPPRLGLAWADEEVFLFPGWSVQKCRSKILVLTK